MKILLTIPIYNEEQYIHSVLNAAKLQIRDILVVNDGSTDNTSKALLEHRHIQLLQHMSNQGYGQCLIDAFSYGALQGYDWIITMDCDFQHEPRHIPAFLNMIRQNQADIISGSRYLNLSQSSLKYVPPERRHINLHITRMLNRTLGLHLTDSFCGFKAYRLSALEQLSLSVSGYGLPLQLWVQAAAHNLDIEEIPVPLIYHDPNRHFQGDLENPDARLAYYTSIINSEMESHVNLFSA